MLYLCDILMCELVVNEVRPGARSSSSSERKWSTNSNKVCDINQKLAGFLGEDQHTHTRSYLAALDSCMNNQKMATRSFPFHADLPLYATSLPCPIRLAEATVETGIHTSTTSTAPEDCLKMVHDAPLHRLKVRLACFLPVSQSSALPCPKIC